MAKKLDPRLLEILTTYGERPEDALWDCHGTWVAYHAAVERIAAKAGVWFELPMIVESNTQSKTVAIAVRGIMGRGDDKREEWSFGEASPANNKNAYPYAMAEKRAKDRVTLKLVGMHGLVYSEEESDDFKERLTPDTRRVSREEVVNVGPDGIEYASSKRPLRDNLKTNKQTGRTSANSLKQDKSPDNWDAFEQELAECETVNALTKLAMAWSSISQRDVWPHSWHELAKEKINDRREALINGPREQSDFPGDPGYVNPLMAG
jgi:hypothetical protein